MSAPAPRRRVVAALSALLVLGGCATSRIDADIAGARVAAEQRLGTDARWLTTDEARRQAERDVDALLAAPIAADDAVRIALAYSPGLQALLFDGAGASADATQGARLPNPVFTFERLARRENGARELDIGRMLSFGVVDLLLLPQRLRLADAQRPRTRLRVAGDIVQAALDTRQAWVRAVAAQQSLRYAEQVKEAADASAELARRMQAVGNFSRLQRAREQAFSADAVVQLARARARANREREALVRALGLDEARAARLQLPERLPDLPAAARDERSTLQAGIEQRLDVALARASLEQAARAQGLTGLSRWLDGLHLGVVRNSETGAPPQKGFELELPLPIFDGGDALRSGAQARTMAALNRAAQLAVDAGSQLREAYVGYRTAYDLARHYRDEVVPLRKAITDENLLRYNGMLIGVFELLADAREQIAIVAQALDAQKDFWLADAALQGALVGRPIGMPSASQAASSVAPSAGGAH
jgi:outer membrane protein TolC